MVIKLIAIGKRVPEWVNQEFFQYARRLRASIRLELIEVDAVKRSPSSEIITVIREEGRRLLKAAPKSFSLSPTKTVDTEDMPF